MKAICLTDALDATEGRSELRHGSPIHGVKCELIVGEHWVDDARDGSA
jgi:hypothetical protein